MTDLPSAPAARLGSPRWLDTRVVLGVLLLVISVLAGSFVIAAAQHTTPVLVVTADLPRGHVLAPADLQVTDVRLPAEGSRYLAADQRDTVVGRVLDRALGRRELLPRSAVVQALAEPVRLVSFPVPAAHAVAGDIAVGDRVDVLATVSQPPPGSTSVVVEGVTVAAVDAAGGGLADGGKAITVTVVLAPEQVLAVTQASQTAAVDVVVVQEGRDGQTGTVRASPSASPSAPAVSSAPTAPGSGT